jgi:ABC-2 type transport system ATP-binding protein
VKTLLEFRKVRKYYRNTPALFDLDLEVPEGALVGIVGPNGAGKTTLMKMAAGLLHPDEGTVFFDGAPVLGHRHGQGHGQAHAMKRQVGYVPDDLGVYDNLKVSEYMEFFASCYGISGLTARKKCELLLEQVGLSDQGDLFVAGMSRGMKQRLSFARALIHSPRLLALDEPTSGLDPGMRTEFRSFLQELSLQGITIIISSHLLTELAEICTHIQILDHGKVVLGGGMDELRQKAMATSPLNISVYGEMKKCVDLLRKNRHVKSLTVKDDMVRVEFAGEIEDEIGLLFAMVNAQVPVYRFSREMGSLESLFIQVTGGEGA